MKRSILLSIIAGVSAFGASAQTLESITVTAASKAAQKLENVTSNIEVITADEIEGRRFTSVTEALSSISGTLKGLYAKRVGGYVRKLTEEYLLKIVALTCKFMLTYLFGCVANYTKYCQKPNKSDNFIYRHSLSFASSFSLFIIPSISRLVFKIKSNTKKATARPTAETIANPAVISFVKTLNNTAVEPVSTAIKKINKLLLSLRKDTISSFITISRLKPPCLYAILYSV